MLAAFTVTADGVEVGLIDGGTQGTAFVNLQARASSRIRQGQTVVVTYTDPTDGNDADAVQDTAGNDVATFTTGQNSVPAVTNNSTEVPTAPGAPTGLTATASGTTQIDLSWTVPADNGGRVITGYKIEISPNGTDTWTDRTSPPPATTTPPTRTPGLRPAPPATTACPRSPPASGMTTG